MISTTQEAINVIRCEMCISNEWMTDDFYEALNIVIDALTAQEQLSNDSSELDSDSGELISRQMAIQRCNTCKHEKDQWFNLCADCFDYELWEPMDEEERWCGNESDRS